MSNLLSFVSFPREQRAVVVCIPNDLQCIIKAVVQKEKPKACGVLEALRPQPLHPPLLKEPPVQSAPPSPPPIRAALLEAGFLVYILLYPCICSELSLPYDLRSPPPPLRRQRPPTQRCIVAMGASSIALTAEGSPSLLLQENPVTTHFKWDDSTNQLLVLLGFPPPPPSPFFKSISTFTCTDYVKYFSKLIFCTNVSRLCTFPYLKVGRGVLDLCIYILFLSFFFFCMWISNIHFGSLWIQSHPLFVFKKLLKNNNKKANRTPPPLPIHPPDGAVCCTWRFPAGGAAGKRVSRCSEAKSDLSVLPL